jgi:hypothetical protein
VAPSGTDHASAAGIYQKRHPIGLMETDGPNVHHILRSYLVFEKVFEQ